MMLRSGQYRRLLPWAAAILLALVLLLGVGLGTTWIPPAEVARALVDGPQPVDQADWQATAVWRLRLPRVLLAAMVGASLAVAGVLLQGLFRNPLAAPGILGLSQGAALGAVIAIAAGYATASTAAIPLAAFLGAGTALGVMVGVVLQLGRDATATLLLAGVALNFLLGAMVALVLSFQTDTATAAQQILVWTLGGVDLARWPQLAITGPCLAVGAAIGLWLGRDLDVMLEGETTARSLGVPIKTAAVGSLIATTLLVAGAVAVAGPIGFVGLIIPQAVRLVLGPAHRPLIVGSAWLGAPVLVLADLVARTAPTQGGEMRLGVVTALVGAPAFLWLLLRKREMDAW